METNILTLNPSELIKWCKARKKELELSNAVISEKTGVPVGTIDRIFSGNYSEFKYSSIQPVVSFLVGFNKETPQPQDADSTQEQYYYNTIEGYKLIVENKNHQISQLKLNIEKLLKDIDFLKIENDRKAVEIEKYQELISKMQDTIAELAKK